MGKCRFQNSWLDPKVHKNWTWLQKADNHKAQCTLCNTVFDVSNMGIAAIRSHEVGKKHHANAVARNISKRLSSFETLTEQTTCSDQMKFTRVTEGDNINESAAQKNVPLQMVNIASESHTDTSRVWNKYIVKDEVTRAEILWVLNKVMCHNSARAEEKAAELFPIMFTDSEIAKKMTMHKDKIGYVSTFGLGPFFQRQVVTTIKECQFYSISFDESLNTVAQMGQMDIVIRFWNNNANEVSTRYLTSAFLGHATAEDLTTVFISTLRQHEIDMDKILQVAMDGPNVNWKFLKNFKEYLKEDRPDHPKLLETGSCSLHIIHGAYKTSHDKSGWKVNQFLRSMYYIFKNFPSRRADYKNSSGSEVFPLKFCTIRWVENSAVIQRAIKMLPYLKKYTEAVSKKPPASHNYIAVKDFISDPFLAAKLGFLHTVSSELEGILTTYQSNNPLLPFLWEDLKTLIRSLLSRFIKQDVLKGTSSSQLTSINLQKPENRKPIQAIEIGFAAAVACKGLKDLDVVIFRKDCHLFLENMCLKLLNKCPLNYRIVKSSTCLSPHVMQDETIRKLRITTALETFVEQNRMSPLVADIVKREYIFVCESPSAARALSTFDRKEHRLDHYLMELFEKERVSMELKTFAKQIFVLFHGNAAVERSFSINKDCLVENLKEASLIAQRSIFDGVLAAGGTTKIDVTKQMILAVRNASCKRQEALKAQKDEKKTKIDQKQNLVDEINKMKMKRKKVMTEAESKADEMDNEIKKLRRALQK